jgi:serine/threonine-protein kinase
VIPASEIQGKHVITLEQARQESGATVGLQVSLQQSGDLVRATYTLTDARQGRALGANSITAPVTDSFAIQDQVAAGAASALGIELRPEERRELLSHGTSLPDAYNYFLQSQGYLEDTNKPENIESAVILLNQALKLDPNYGAARAELGMAYWWKYALKKDKRWINAAREACSKAVESGNAGAQGHVCLGLLHNGTGQYEPAVVEFQRAVELEPANDQAYSGLALAFQRLNKLDEAEKTYQRVITLRPQYPLGYKLLGAFYLRQAQAVKAAEMFSRMVALAPDSYPAYSNLAAALLYQARYEDAIKPLEQSIAIRPTYFAYTNLGTAYLRLRRFAEAARAYQQATQLDGVQYVAWGSLGDAYHYSGDRPQALNAYQKAVQLAHQQLQVNPRDAEVLGDVADYYAMQGDRKQALAYLDHSLQFGHGDKDLLFNAAVVYDELGETGVALEWLKKSLDAGVSVTTVRESLAFDNLKGDPRLEGILRSREN